MRRGWGGLAAAAVAMTAVGVLLTTGGVRSARGPVARPNPSVQAPEIVHEHGARRVRTTHPAELLLPDTVRPTARAQLLWFEGRATAPTADGAVTLDPAGEPVHVGPRLLTRRLRFHLDGRTIASVAAAGGDRFWVSTRDGAVLLVGPDGTVRDSLVSPFAYSTVTAGPDGRAWAVRSAEQFEFPFGRAPAPLVVPVRHTDSLPVPARRPAVALFTHLVNAGRIAIDTGGFVYFAPFIRDEIVKFAPTGDTIWVATRGLPHGVDEPRFELDADGRPTLDYAPVNLGLQLGPDGRVYALSTPGYTTAHSRVDVLDPETGVVLRTATLDTPLPTLAADAEGRVYRLDPFALLTGVAPAERARLAAFDLERLGGGRVRLEDFAGRILLVNVWASWCAPCREEMPALDRLAATFAGEPFAFVALSEDVDPAQAAAFIREYGFTFPVGLGRGTLRARYHYFGLPFTVLVDAGGHVMYRWAGYGGEEQIEGIRALVRAELRRTAAAVPAESHEAHDGRTPAH